MHWCPLETATVIAGVSSLSALGFWYRQALHILKHRSSLSALGFWYRQALHILKHRWRGERSCRS